MDSAVCDGCRGSHSLPCAGVLLHRRISVVSPVKTANLRTLLSRVSYRRLYKVSSYLIIDLLSQKCHVSSRR
jgi:hypothetical protein